MFVVIDKEGRVVARTNSSERAHRVARMAKNLGRRVLVHDDKNPRERKIFDRQVRVVISGHKERIFGESTDASEWAHRHLKQKMTIGAHARFYKGSRRAPYAVLKLTERGAVVTLGANVGSVV